MTDYQNKPDDETRGTEFVHLLTSHQLDLYLYVHSLVPNRNDAAEIVQEANVVLWQKRSQFEPGRDFRPWAFQIARFEVMKHRTKCKRKHLCFSDALVDDLALEAGSTPPLTDDSVERMRHCVEQLTVKDRDVLSQRYSSAATCESIANAAGRPVTWVYNALRRIRHELLQCMARHTTARREP